MRLKRKSEGTPFERWGGQPFFDALVEQFYVGVVTDPLLRPMYQDDLGESKSHLALFLGQYWGGPDTYNRDPGPPAAADAPRPVRDRPGRGRGVDAAHDGCRRRHGHGPRRPCELLDYLSMAARSLQNAR